MQVQDKNVVRTAADLEKKYNLGQLIGLRKNVEVTGQTLIKVENELNNMLSSFIINLSDVLDTQSSISLWFYEGIPTTSNEPYIDWVTPADHYGDFYYDQNSGYVYKYTTLGWELQSDTNLINAMALTNVELDVTLDHERQVFFEQPTPPYQSGDWWVLDDGTLMICQLGKPVGETYEKDDFIVSSKYVTTIAVKQNDTIEVLKGQVVMITDTMVSYTDKATGKTTAISGDSITTGNIKSANYVANTSGTKISLTDGTIDSKNFKVDSTGNITATGGKIAEYTISGAKLVGTNVGLSGKSGDGWAFWAGSDTPVDAPFRVGHTGALRATNAEITGNITATSGTFSGTINTSQNCTVGNNLYVGQNTGSSAVDTKYLYFNDNAYIRKAQSSAINLNIIELYGSSSSRLTTGYYGGYTSRVEATSDSASMSIRDGNGDRTDYISLSPSLIQMSRQPVINSDKKLKDKIKDIDVSWIDELKVKEYVYKTSKEKKQIGLIAQDYEGKDYAEYFLNKNQNGLYGIEYGNITNALIQYCQELKKEVQKLKEEVKELKNEK